MKRLNLFFFCLLAMIALAGNAQEKQADVNGYIVKVGEQAPDFTVKLTDGQSVKLSSLRGVACVARRCHLSRRTSGRSTRITKTFI